MNNPNKPDLTEKQFDIVFAIMALREVNFFGKVALHLQGEGRKVGFITFHEAADRRLSEMGIPYFSMHKLARKSRFQISERTPRDLEERYGISHIRSLWTHDKYTHGRLNETEHLEKLAIYLDILDEILKTNSIGCVIQELGGFVANQSIFYACSKNHVPHISIEPAMFAGRLIFNKDTFQYDIPKWIEETPQALQDALGHVTNYLKNKNVNIPTKDRHHLADMGLAKLLSPKNFQKLARKIYHKYVTREDEEYNAIGHIVRYNIYKLLRRKILSLWYSHPQPGERYVYYPLHVPHDFQIFVRSPEFMNQEALVGLISQALPVGYKLYVKEHPLSIGAHPLYPIWNFLRDGTVRLIHPRTNSFDLVQNASCVVTINSKVGVEAITQGKSVVVLGKTFYRGQGVTHDVKNLEDLPAILKHAIKNPPTSAAIQKFVARAYAYSYPGELYVHTEDNLNNFTQSLKSFIQEYVSKAVN